MNKINTLFEPDIDLSIFKPYTIDCSKCCGLCCVALYFSKIDGFPDNKNAGIPCNHLQHDYKCKIHSTLSKRGLKGCMAYDCFGAGQQITSHLAEPPNWKVLSSKETKTIFDSFSNIMQVHQVLWYLTVASTLGLEKSKKEQISLLLNQGKELTSQSLEILQNMDIKSFREKSSLVLRKICLNIANKFSAHGKSDSNPNYMGKNFKQKNLIGKDFSMSLLIAANLEGANLLGANFLGADMRDTNIKNTDLSHSLFLTQIQINAARGNENTVLPPYLYAPISWQH